MYSFMCIMQKINLKKPYKVVHNLSEEKQKALRNYCELRNYVDQKVINMSFFLLPIDNAYQQ